ncbi:MAG: FtsX-like permease family protein [Thermoanaerobaculia bacterium]
MSSVSLPLWIAIRYLKSSRRDAFITFLSLTAAGGIALGVAALILALAALSGFQAALKGEVLSRTPDIEVELPAGADAEAARREVDGVDGVRSAQIVVRGRGWLLARGRSRAVEMIGFGAELPALFPGATSRNPGLYLGDGLVSLWGMEPGDVVEVVSPVPTLTPVGPQPRVRRLPVVGSFAAGRAEQEERLALPLSEASLLFGRSAVYRLLVDCSDLGTALEVAGKLPKLLPAGSTVRTWRDLNRVLFFALRLEKTLMFVAVFLIVVVAGMSLVSDLTLILASKRPEVGMLGAMGAAPSELRRIFLWLGGLLVGLGALIGLVLGVGGAWLLDRYELLSLPSQVYFLDHVPFLVRARDVLSIVGTTVVLTFACSFYAAHRAASLWPVEALRR